MVPIVIFAYNRPRATQRLLQSLLRNPETKDSPLYIFIDGPKNADDADAIEEVVATAEEATGFASLQVQRAQQNRGLARSIIDGVTTVLQQHPEVIVLEDDLVVTSDFLRFMNAAVNTYRDRQDIWSISGYTPNIDIPRDYEDDVFLVPRAQSWGWATWRNRWQQADWEATDYARLAADKNLRVSFNQGGNDLYHTLDMERHGKIESWAIRWCFAGFMHHAYTVNPITSKVQNLGMEGSNTHRGWNDRRHNVVLSNMPIQMNPDVQPNATIMQAFKAHHDLGFVSSVGYFLRRYGLGYHLIKKHM